MSDAHALAPEAYAAALAAFDLMTVHRLSALLRHHDPEEAFAVATGASAPAAETLIARVLEHEGVRTAWQRCGRRIRPEAVWERCEALSLQVLVRGSDGYPPLFLVDPQPPPVVFARGDLDLLDGRRVALIGTRNATAAGRSLARSFGAGLARQGVHVVSGLALGIDGQAHAGVFEAADRGATGRPIAVVGSGHDVVYPKAHRELWWRVGEEGLLLSEWPPGATPLAFHFPQRNRLVAALSEVVVVVESRETGGSLITAQLAAERGVPVMAVPGSAFNRAANGVNALLRDGSAPVLDVDDVLVALGLDHGRTHPTLPFDTERRVRPRPEDVPAYRACATRASTVGDVADALGHPLIEVAMSLARLEQGGWLAHVDGWFEVVGSPFPTT